MKISSLWSSKTQVYDFMRVKKRFFGDKKESKAWIQALTYLDNDFGDGFSLWSFLMHEIFEGGGRIVLQDLESLEEIFVVCVCLHVAESERERKKKWYLRWCLHGDMSFLHGSPLVNSEVAWESQTFLLGLIWAENVGGKENVWALNT